MSSTSRSGKFKSLFKLLQKRFKHAPEVPTRSVLEHLIYAACLENATYEQADGAFIVLEHHYIDWNEIRVSTANELAYTFPQLPDPLAAGERVRRTLQSVFEKTYMFDLEELRKKNLSQAVDFLESLGGCSRFMGDYTVQSALGGHVIPLDEAALRVFRLLDLAQVSKDKTREEVSGLERAIPKNQGILFAGLLHQFASGFYTASDFEELRSLLKTVDPQASRRDCAAPELEPPKIVKTEKPQPPVPPIHAVAPTAIDEDLDPVEEPVGVEEVEFIPNPITGEESVYEEEEDGDSRPTQKSKSKKAGQGKSGVKTDSKSDAKPAKSRETRGKKTRREPVAAVKPEPANSDSPKRESKKKPEKTAPKKPEKSGKSPKTSPPPVQEKKGGKGKSAIPHSGKSAAREKNSPASSPKGGKSGKKSGKEVKKEIPKPPKNTPGKKNAKGKTASPPEKKTSTDNKGKSLTRTLRQKKPK